MVVYVLPRSSFYIYNYNLAMFVYLPRYPYRSVSKP